MYLSTVLEVQRPSWITGVGTPWVARKEAPASRVAAEELSAVGVHIRQLDPGRLQHLSELVDHGVLRHKSPGGSSCPVNPGAAAEVGGAEPRGRGTAVVPVRRTRTQGAGVS